MTPRRWVASLAAHPRHVVLAAAVGGLVAGPRAPWAAWAAAGLLLALGLAAGGALPRGVVATRTALPLLAAAVVVLVAGAGARARLAAIDRTTLGPWLGHAVDVTGYVLRPPRARSFGRSAVLVGVRYGPGAGERLLVETTGAVRAGVGDEVRARGGLRPLPEFEAAMRRAGAHALLNAPSVVATGRLRGGVLGAVDGVRRRAEAALRTGLPPPLAGLERGMVLGEDAELTDDMTEDFRASGLAHLVAASGANVALLAALVLALGAAMGLPRTPRLWLAVLLVAGYVPLAGGGPSIQRAGIMGAATLVAALASQPASRWYAVLLAAATTLALDPRAVEDPGWQLSFAAVLALLALAPPLRAALGRRLPSAVADALAVCLAASLATAPLIALHFGRVSWVTIPANLLAVPAVAPVMWLGSAAAAVGQLGAGLAAPLNAVAAWPLAFVAWVGRTGAALPGANAEVALGLPLALLWAGLLAAFSSRRVRKTAGERGRRLGAPLLATVLVAAVLLGAGTRAAPPSGLSVAALDVGQGDATLIRDGPYAVLFDAGPPDGPILRRLDELGVGRLDLLVVTHAQADHEGGAAAVLGELPVGLVLDGRDGVASPDGERFAAVARARGVRLLTPAAGQRIRVGPIVVDVLSPRAEPAALHAGEDPNQRAIVARLSDGAFSMLLTADAESDVLRSLPLAPVDVLKVSHHGSDDPGLPALLTRLRPATALIEVGRHNTYGHPAPATLEALRGLDVRRTDTDGTVVLRP
ncbi:MAG: ComEC/Rec2 family competence protein [Solirubrobacteraceae bacterium]